MLWFHTWLNHVYYTVLYYTLYTQHQTLNIIADNFHPDTGDQECPLVLVTSGHLTHYSTNVLISWPMVKLLYTFSLQHVDIHHILIHNYIPQHTYTLHLTPHLSIMRAFKTILLKHCAVQSGYDWNNEKGQVGLHHSYIYGLACPTLVATYIQNFEILTEAQGLNPKSQILKSNCSIKFQK